MIVPPTGVGLGLRAAFIERIERGEADGRVAFLEVAPENYMHRGGKAPRRLAAIAERIPVISHGLMMSLGSTDPFDDAYFTDLRDFLARIDAPWHSDHLCWSGVDGALLHDLLPVPFTTASATRIASRVREAQDRLGRTMAVENVSWYLQLGAPQKDEPEFVTEVLERADCQLMLDVNNVFVNSANHGFDPYDWLRKVPLDRVIQLHIAGHDRWEDDLIVDTHGNTVRPEVYDLLAWVIERTGPKPVVLERDSDIPPLPTLLDEVARIDEVYQAAVGRWRATSPQEVARHGS
ncbi:MAG: DUF692 domain-containing protein [Deltaproteobacteria bacterium]|nr:DUF692 domain-containing protein [Deltaproteobacteria bacterium]MBK8240359.1 DUF692 domain-containing protein [Deltaproteobacteria bacterium]MBK8718361.1 DUF692 domain-containing protein [Deltaproteobacteria bacterium]MBP7290378.1 DUF692 domain-containing protein [Nannocystaceae bacterium]